MNKRLSLWDWNSSRSERGVEVRAGINKLRMQHTREDYLVLNNAVATRLVTPPPRVPLKKSFVFFKGIPTLLRFAGEDEQAPLPV